MAKSKLFLITIDRNEAGIDSIEQHIARAYSRKEAIDTLLAQEGITIEEKPYVQEETDISIPTVPTEDAQ
jgi:hypothetical protein